ILAGRAQSLGGFGMSRVSDSIGGVALSAPQASLTGDFYPPEVRGKVFALSGVTGRTIGFVAPGLVLFLFKLTKLTWRLPYFVTGPMLILAGIATIFLLKEPIRGYMERKSLGLPEEVAVVPEDPPSFGEAWRTIWAIRTLRRLFISQVFAGPGDVIFAFFFPLFITQTYNLTINDRFVLGIITGLTALPFGFLAGGLIDVLLRRRPQRVLILSGLLSVASAVAVAGIALAPPYWALVVISVVFGAVSALIGPAAGVLFINILPAHVRSLGASVQALAVLPGTIFRVAAVGFVFTKYGLAGALFITVPFFFISALIQLSAAGLYERDVKAAIASQAASEEWRRAKDDGEGKLLVCRKVDVEYDGVQVLFGVDFDVEEGDIIALLGTNGAGKSTLLRAISGTQEATAGAVVFDGRDTTHMPPHEIAGRGVIHMPGGRGVFPGLSVKENILMGNWLEPDAEEKKTRLAEVFEIFPILKERQNENAGTLSGGEQQMLSLAQAFLSKPKLLMIDELSLGLSPAVVQQLIEIVQEIHRRGVTIIVVEQSVNVALTIAERAIFMEKGEVKFIGKTADLLRRPDILRAVYVKGSGALTEGGPSSTMKSERQRREYELGQARPILEVKELSRSYGGIKAVSEVSFELREGESLGLIGPNGAGKTTLFDLISGYQSPDSGQVIYDGKDITGLRADQRAQQRLIRRFQDARLFPSLTVFENLLVALDRKLDVRNVALTALQVPQVRQAERRVRLRAERLIELLELGAFREKFVKELSTGVRRIADIACVLASEPRVLMLDEPSSGIAQAESEGLAPLLRRVRFETGCSMLVIEHDMPLISAISDELIALDQGKFVMRGTPEVVLNDERVIESYLGTKQEVVKRSGVIN
ncbi:MAG: MFS transporter, partial [Actinobacteria bacterium]|nr:MFS transporter [Actinomycetota bacterium]